jgi:hypothetical protein
VSTNPDCASLHPGYARFPPLEGFGRRAPVSVAPFVSGRHPKPFTKADLRDAAALPDAQMVAASPKVMRCPL